MQDFTLPQAQPFDFPGGDHGVLLIHGFTGSPAHMRLIGEGLREKGFGVRGIFLPGHGETPEALKNVRWQDWLLTCRQAAWEMKERYARFSVAGLSMGGCLALMLAEQMNVDACVTIAAPMKTTNRFRPLSPALAVVQPMIFKQENGSRDTLIPEYDLGYDCFPTASVGQLNAIMRKARRELHLIHCPILVIQSRGDATVTPDSPEIILSGVTSAVKARLWLNDAPHVCTIAPEYPKIIEGMGEFLQKWGN